MYFKSLFLDFFLGNKYRELRTAGKSRQLPTDSRRENVLVEQEEEEEGEDEAEGTKED